MHSHEVIRDAIEAVGPKQVAADIGVSLSLVYKWAQPNSGGGSGSPNPLDRVAQLTEITGDLRLLEWLCRKCDGYFVNNPRKLRSKDYDLMPATNEIVHQFADLLRAISQAALDNSISHGESAEIRGVWDRLKSFTEGFVRCCEMGDFRPLNQLKIPPPIETPSP